MRTPELMDKIEAAMIRYRASDPANAADTFTEETIQELRSNLTTCVALGDERVSLALQTYEMVRLYFLAIRIRHCPPELECSERALAKALSAHIDLNCLRPVSFKCLPYSLRTLPFRWTNILDA